jgi:hypothetical protein
VFLSSRNIIKHLNLKGKEYDLIVEFLKELGNKVEKNASDNWSIIKSEIIKETSFEIAKISNISIDKSELEKHLMAALGHSGYGAGGENPHWCNQNNANWPTFFSQRAATGIIESISAAVNNQISLVNGSNRKIQDLLKNALSKLLKENANQNNSLHLRSELLWWKEACFSNTIKSSYRDAQNGLLQVIIALDYSSFVPFIYPQSADYFLKETHAGIISFEDKKIKLSEIFKCIDSSKETLEQYLGEESFEIERVSLTQFVKGYVYGKYSIKQLKDIVGISDNIELTLSEFTLWLFHDLQVLNYSKSK